MSGDFGLLALFPGIVESPPAFSFYRTGIGGSVDQFIASATGEPRLVYSLFSGSGQFLDNTRSVDNSFYFSTGRMFFGQGEITTNPTAKGNLNIFWNGAENSGIQAGLVVHDTNQFVGSGKPVSIYRTAHDTDYLERSSFLARRAEFKSNLGGYKTQLLPGPMAYEAVNFFASNAFENPETDGANDSSLFDGFGFGRWDGQQNLFTNLALHKDYVELGHFLQTSTKQNIGGEGSLVVRQGISPTSYHTSGTTLFSSGDGSFNVITSSGKGLQFGPGISGVDRISVSNDIYKSINYGVGTVGVIDNSFDGKVAVNSKIGTHSIEFAASLRNGFSCEILHNTSSSCLMYPEAGGLNYNPEALEGPGAGERTYVRVRSSTLFLNNSQTPTPVFLSTKANLYPRLTSGAATGFFESNGSSRWNSYTIDFDPSSKEYCQGEFLMPFGWNSFKAELIWTATSGAGNVVWNVASSSMEDNYSIGESFGSPVVVTDSKVSNSGIFRCITAATTPAGILGIYQNLPVKLEISRDATNIADTLSADARLLGVTITKAG